MADVIDAIDCLPFKPIVRKRFLREVAGTRCRVSDAIFLDFGSRGVHGSFLFSPDGLSKRVVILTVLKGYE